MKQETILTRHTPRWAALAGIVLLAVLAGVVHAAWTTINTNDGQVDAGWGSPDYSDPCTFTSRQVDEIKNAWVRWDGTAIYFRIETCAGPPLTPKSGSGLQTKSMRAVAAIDCNKNGTYTDNDSGGVPNGDRLVVYYDNTGPNSDQVWLLTGSGTAVFQLPDTAYSEEVPPPTATSIEWQMPLQYLYPACRASTDTLNIMLATVEVQSNSSTTIDQTNTPIAWHNPIDYGDLNNPNPANNTCEQYPTRLPCNGARHGVVVGTAILGQEIDPDQGNLHNASALADDASNTGSVDDEDGVQPTRAFAWSNSGGGSLSVTVSGGSGYLSCWIDWNGNNSLTDSGEKVISGLAVSTGGHTPTFSIPISPLGLYYARCRVSPTTGVGVTGPIYGGEVEDYRWLPQTSALSISKPNASDVQLSWNDLSASDGYNLYRSPAPYFSPGDTGVTLLSGSPFADPPVTDAGVLGNASDDNYFYVMTKTRTVDSVVYESVPSNTVGLFEFALVPGAP